MKYNRVCTGFSKERVLNFYHTFPRFTQPFSSRFHPSRSNYCDRLHCYLSGLRSHLYVVPFSLSLARFVCRDKRHSLASLKHGRARKIDTESSKATHRDPFRTSPKIMNWTPPIFPLLSPPFGRRMDERRGKWDSWSVRVFVNSVQPLRRILLNASRYCFAVEFFGLQILKREERVSYRMDSYRHRNSSFYFWRNVCAKRCSDTFLLVVVAYGIRK